MSDFQIYHFQDPVDFAAAEFDRRQQKNPRFSLRAWSRQLGYTTPSYLGQVLKRQRKFQIELARKIALNLNLKANDQKYFEALVLFQNARTPEEKAIYQQMIESLRPAESKPVLQIEYEAFRFISEWVHTALLEVVNLRGFDGSLGFIERRLDHRTSRNLLDSAVDRLIRLKLLRKLKNGKIQRSSEKSLLFDQEFSDLAIQSYHAQVLDRSKEALLNQSIQERDFRASTIAIKLKDFKKAQAVLKKAHADLVALNADGSADEVYQLQSGLFRISKKGPLK